jgi:DNA-binding PadR family transcriptional regulator
MGGLVTRSTVDMAVLSVVIERPGHGYDIGTRFVSRYEGLYRTTVQHVYKNLSRLAEHECIEPLDVEADEPPVSRGQAQKATFRATATGARTFRRWIAGPMAPSAARRELFTRLRALQAVRPNDYHGMLALLDRYQEAVLGSIGFVGRGPAVTVVDELAHEDHEATIEGQLRWCDAAREKLLDRVARELSG